MMAPQSQASLALAAAVAKGDKGLPGKNMRLEPCGRPLNPSSDVYYIDLNPPKNQPQVTIITQVKSERKMQHSQFIAVNSSYISYALKAGPIRVIHKHISARSLFKSHSAPVVDMAFSAMNSNVLASIDANGEVYVRKLQETSNDEIAEQHLLHVSLPMGDSGGRRLAWHPGYEDLLALSTSDRVVLLQVPAHGLNASEQATPIAPDTATTDGKLTGLAFSPEGNALAAADSEGWVSLWSLDPTVFNPVDLAAQLSQAPLRFSPFNGERVGALELLVSGPGAVALLTGDASNTHLKLWDLDLDPGSGSGRAPTCTYSLQFASSQDASKLLFNVITMLPMYNAVVLANFFNGDLHIIHLCGYGTGQLGFDYITTFKLMQPVLSMVAIPGIMVPGNSEEPILPQFQVYCVQTDAVQLYSIQVAQCFPEPESESEVEERDEVSPNHSLPEVSAAIPEPPPMPHFISHVLPSKSIASHSESHPLSAASEPAVPLSELRGARGSVEALAASIRSAPPAAVDASTLLPERLAPPQPVELLHGGHFRSTAENATTSHSGHPGLVPNLASIPRPLHPPTPAKDEEPSMPPMPRTLFQDRTSSENFHANIRQEVNHVSPQPIPVATSHVPAHPSPEPLTPETGPHSILSPRHSPQEPPSMAPAPVAPASVPGVSMLELQNVLLAQQTMIADMAREQREQHTKLSKELAIQMRALEASQQSAMEAAVKSAVRREREELQRVLVSTVNSSVRDMLREVKAHVSDAGRQTVGTLTATLSGSVESAVSSSMTAQMAGPGVRSAVEGAMQAALPRAVADSLAGNFRDLLIPRFEQATRNMFSQIERALEKTIETELHDIASTVRSASTALGESVGTLTGAAGSLRADSADAVQSLTAAATAIGNQAAALAAAATTRSAAPPPKALSVADIEARQDPRAVISGHLTSGDLPSAFIAALSANSVSTVTWLITKLNAETVLSYEPCPLPPSIILSLVQQLSTELSTDSSLKLDWIVNALTSSSSDLNAAVPQVRQVLVQLRQAVEGLMSTPGVAKDVTQMCKIALQSLKMKLA